MIYRVTKMTLGFILGAWLASLMGLQYFTSAGIIVMLSLLDTKKQTFEVAWKRIYMSMIGFILTGLIFRVMGFNLWAFGVFLLVFIPISLSLKAPEGIVMNTVIATHLYAFGQISSHYVINELGLLTIGISVAIVLNLHMPSLEHQLKHQQLEIEKRIKGILLQMSYNLKNLCLLEDQTEVMTELEAMIKSSKLLALKHVNNMLLTDQQIYVDYFQMRMDQFYWILYMQKHFKNFFVTQTEAMLLSEFTAQMASKLSVNNDPSPLLDELSRIKSIIDDEPIPTNRIEFENYSALYQYMNDLETFILLKLAFSKKYL